MMFRKVPQTIIQRNNTQNRIHYHNNYNNNNINNINVKRLSSISTKEHKVLVIGGYGNFGKRICKFLSDEKYNPYAENSKISLIIAGRNFNAAKEFAEELEKEFSKKVEYEELNFHNLDQLTKIIKERSVDTVVHTSGPFNQINQKNYAVPKTCIQNGVNYVDISDDCEYVVNIKELNELAKEKKVKVISGASTVPATSSAIVDHLSSSLSSVSSISYNLNPGSKTVPEGRSTLLSILSMSGKKYTSLLNGKPIEKFNFLQPKLQNYFGILKKRIVCNYEIPDHYLFPDRYIGVKTIDFKAGVELKIQQIAMTMMGFLSKYHFISSWKFFIPLILLANRFLSIFGSDHGAMFVEVKGKVKEEIGEREETKKYYLHSEKGAGPNIPVIPIVLLTRKLSLPTHFTDKPPNGAYACLGLISLFELEKFWQKIHSFSTYSFTLPTENLLAKCLGDISRNIPKQILDFHSGNYRGFAKGNLNCKRGKGIGNFIATLARFPKENEITPVVVHVDGGVWHRNFNNERSLNSKWNVKNGFIIERFGVFSFIFQMKPIFNEENNVIGFEHVFKKMKLFGFIPVPSLIAVDPSGKCFAIQKDDQKMDKKSWFVEVNIQIPLIGKLASYSGIMSIV